MTTPKAVRGRRWPGWVLVCAIVALGGVLAGWKLQGADVATDGPLRVFPEHGYVIHVTGADAGRVFTDGYDVVRVRGSRPVHVLRVESLGGAPPLRFLGAKVAGPHRKYGADQMMRGFPPRERELGKVSPLRGATLLPQSRTGSIGYELLLGYRITAARLGARRTIRVTYESGGQQYRADIAASIVICPPGRASRACAHAVGVTD